jgi:GT2 family glycosyltransferase
MQPTTFITRDHEEKMGPSGSCVESPTKSVIFSQEKVENRNMVSIIIVNFHTANLISNCVASIFSFEPALNFEIIIVDNSRDLSQKTELFQLKERFPLILIFSNSNLGFGKANNEGFKVATGEYILFLNSDTILVNNAVSIMKDFLEMNCAYGAVGPLLFSKSMKPVFSYQKRTTSIGHTLLDRSFFSAVCRRSSNFINRQSSKSVIQVNGFLTGAALMIRRDLFEKIGGFDKDIFMYAEDDLLCQNVKSMGFHLACLPGAKIIHLEGGSDSKRWSVQKCQSFIKGSVIFYEKVYGMKRANQFLHFAIIFYKYLYVRSLFRNHNYLSLSSAAKEINLQRKTEFKK